MKKLLFLLLTAFSCCLPRLATSQVTISAENLTICSGGTVSVDILVTNFTNVTGLEFPIRWNPAVLQYTGQTFNLPPITGVNNGNANIGELNVTWFDAIPPGNTYANGFSILTVHFNVLGNYVSNSSTAISLTDVSFPSGVYVNGGLAPDPTAVFVAGSVTIADSQQPTFSGCPPTVTVTGSTATWTPPTASDNCTVASVTSNYAPGATFPGGTTTVTYVATDGAGNTGTCSFPVTIVGTQLTFVVTDDTIECGDSTVEVEVRTFNYQNVSGLQFDLGWDISLLSYDTAWLPAGYPVFGGISTVNVATGLLRYSWFDPSIPLGDVTLPPNTLVLTLRLNMVDPTPANFANTGITFEPPLVFLDQNSMAIPLGNVVLDSAQLLIFPDDPPTFTTCPSNFSVNSAAGQCGATATWAVPTATDDCSTPTVVRAQGAAPGTFFAVGQHTILYTATDDAGQKDTCTFKITVVDNQPPSITCPASQSLPNAAGLCSATATWTAPTPTDNCPGVTAVASHAPGSSFPVGTTAVTYVATDAAGLTGTCSFNVTVTDTQSPNLGPCPADITQTAMTGACQNTVTWTAPPASDNCTLVSNVPSHASGSMFPVGSTTVTYVATDQAGNVSTCQFMVMVEDDENPTITCPGNLNLPTDAGVCTAVATWTPPTPGDNCPGATANGSHAPGSAFNLGTTTVTYTASDTSGNTATCSFTVTVADDEAPVIPACPDDISQSNDAGDCGAVVFFNAPAGVTDNCTLASLLSNPAPGSTFSVGTTTVTFTAADAAGNSATCDFEVTVTDDEAPEIANCPLDITQGTDSTDCSAIVNWTLPTATDNCQLASFLSNFVQMDTFPPGVTNVTYVATDTAGNQTVCAFDVTVGDDVAPEIFDCPGDITMDNLAGQCTAKVTWTPPTATDNCAFDTLVSNFQSGSLFPVGTTLVIYTATDTAGNENACAFEVEVLDVEAPEFTGCPADSTLSADSVCQAVVFWTEPVATDNCPTVTISRSHEPGDTFAIGTTTVLYVATDAGGNSDSCSFNIIVEDDALPVISNCPADTTVGTDPATCAAVVNWTPPTAADNCSPVTLTSSHDPLDIFLTGTTTVTYTAEDTSGNVVTCVFDVKVEDDEAPAIANCPADTTIVAEPDSCNAIANWQPLTVTDNCPGVTLVSNFDPGDTFPVDSTNVNYVATDAAGNETTCSFLVIVQDTVPPTLAGCPADTTVSAGAGVCEAVVNWVEPTASDNCDLVLTSSHDPGDTFPVGTTQVTYHVEDEGWNQVTCTFNVTVTDDELPTLTCPADTSLTVPDGDTALIVNNIVLSNVSDNCGLDSTWFTLTGATAGGAGTGSGTIDASGTSFNLDTTTVTYFVEDASGNVNSCSFEVVVNTKVELEMTCPDSVSTVADLGECSAVVLNLSPVITPLDSLASVEFFATGATTDSGNDATGLAFGVGTTTVTYLAIDNGGDSTTCSFTVVVADTELPVFMNCNGNDTVSTSNTTCGLFFSGNVLPVATDNCPNVVHSYLPAEGTFLTVGTTSVSALATDEAGNQAICTYSVTVVDDDAPVISGCPGNQSVPAAQGQCGANVPWTAPTATDNCQLLAFTPSQMPGSFFPAGNIPTPVEYVAVDNAGNVSKCQFTVTVTDQQAPALTCPASLTVNAAPNQCSAFVTWGLPQVVENCTVVSLNANQAPGNFDVGTQTVSYSATDAAGNSGTCNFTITVVDNQFPTFDDVPDDIVEIAELGECGATIFWTPPTADDNCGIVSVTGSHQPGTFFPVGDEVTITYTALDENGNVKVVSFTVEVVDVTPPAFDNCPADVTISTDGNVLDDPSGIIVSYQAIDCENIQLEFSQPSATDDCGISSVVMTEGLSSGSIFGLGETTMTFLATDNSGLPNTCSFDITVEAPEAAAPTAFPSNPCEGDAVFFFINDYPGASYEWKDPLGNVISTNSFFNLNNISALQSGTFNLIIDLPSNCTLTGSVDVSVNPNPVITASANDLLCTNGTGDIQLTANVLNGADVVEWVWVYPDQTFAFGQNQTISDATIDDAGTYSVTATTGNGCIGFATVEVEVSLEPVTPSLFGNDNATCVGDQVVLDGQAFQGDEVEYGWFAEPMQGSGLIAFSNDGLTVEPSEPGTYTYYYFVVVDGCFSDTAEWVVNVQAYPTLDPQAVGEQACVDGSTSVTLNANATGDVATWSWEGLTTTFSSDDENPVIANVTSANSDIYEVTATTANGCSATAEVALDISDAPDNPTLTATPGSVCVDEPIQLTATGTYPPGTQFVWTGSNLPPTAPFLQSLTATPGGAGNQTYTFQAVTLDGCSSTIATATVNVENTLSVGITVQGETNCVAEGSTVTLVGSPTGAAGYEWRRMPDNAVISTQQSLVLDSVTAANSGTYSLTVKSNLGCEGLATTTLTITNALAPLTATVSETPCEGGNLTLCANLLPNAIYQWQNPQGQIFADMQCVTIPNADPAMDGTYTVTATQDGCLATGSVAVVVQAPPVANPEDVLVLFDRPQGFDVVANDELTEGKGFTITILEQPTKGSVTEDGNGVFTYTALPGFSESDHVTYRICYDDCPDLCDIGFVTFIIRHDPAECIITSVISPNDDGINDALKVSCLDVPGIEPCPLNRIVIFNQWGDKVYEAQPYQNDWQGTYEGQNLPDGTYYYLFECDPDLPAQKGFVMIYR